MCLFCLTVKIACPYYILSPNLCVVVSNSTFNVVLLCYTQEDHVFLKVCFKCISSHNVIFYNNH